MTTESRQTLGMRLSCPPYHHNISLEKIMENMKCQTG